MAIAIAAALALQGCVPFAVWAQQNAGTLAAITLVGGAVSAAGGALVQVDELEGRIERRIEEHNNPHSPKGAQHGN